uniref:Uncharacterized protein n=1 Tax=Arundo donax TaxID=35708 RepID=A0A0A9BAX2_ARUDO
MLSVVFVSSAMIIEKICAVQNIYRRKSTAHKHLFHAGKIN